MKEATFIRQNIEKWKSIESATSMSADKVVEAYRDVLSDLSYVSAQYPKSRLIPYLNTISRRLHDQIYKPHKKNVLKTVKKLFANDLPLIIADARHEILISLGIFVFFVMGGVILALQDFQNVYDTLGPGYVNMTIDNIKNGVPTNVYNDPDKNGMFVYIFFNNSLVDLKMMLYGLVPFIGAAYFLYANGVMIGEFQTLFFIKGVGFESMLAIWMHGTLEITALIIAAGAAMAFGRSWVDFRTYSIGESMARKGRRAIKIYLSTIPLTFTAAVIESYMTRYAEWPIWLRLGIILLSLAFVIVYYIYMPYVVYKRNNMSIEKILRENGN